MQQDRAGWRPGLVVALLPGALLLAANADPTPTPSIADRYARADRYLRPELDKLIINADLRATFTRDGTGILYRLGSAGKRQILYLDLATSQSRAIVDEARLAELLARATGKEVDALALRLEDADYSAKDGALTFGVADRQWTLNSAGELAEAKKGAPDGEGAVSPDGRFEIVARDFNLFARDRKSGRQVALTTDGTREQPYGRSIPQLADILKAGTEEPKMPVSVIWSPDSRSILSWRLDTRGVERLSITQENPPGSFYPRSFQYVYPLAGAAKLPQATRFTIDVENALKRKRATIVPLDVPSESILYPSPPDMGWSGGKVRVQWTERGYKQLVVYEADPKTGKATITAREAVKPIVTVTSSNLRPAPELGGELAISERSGWAQLYFVQPGDPDGGIPLTRGDWEVLDVAHLDAEERTLLVTGVGRERDRNPYYRALYRVTLDGKQPGLLTPEPLDHEVEVSPDGKYFIDAMSSPTSPTRTVVRDTRDGRIVTELAKADGSALFASGYTPPEPFTGLAADGKTPLYGMIWRPANFDSRARYPIIDAVYTGPTTTNVPTSWNGAVTAGANSVAQLGAVVVTIDGTGTSRRGQAFRLPAWQNLGEVGLDDHIAMIRQMAARYPYIDATRVGVYGGSAGGYDAARFVLRRPKFFKVAVASSGNHDLRLDKAWWPEVSMGNPDEAVWERNSNMSVAKNLRGKLLLIHGDIDDNVPVTESMRLANALITAGRDVDVVILPNTTHRVAQPFFWRKLRDYFTRHLLDEKPPVLPLPEPDPAMPAIGATTK
ncbi:DPP IV N-terminal domain-containing protein [Sphingomonas sp. 7/4-4]|uniref:S9 family peptidase n=1 Tax=Sphingomonas sp. 7/4-4 TaxID=3018446 RepID=UPI0022F3CCC4|nr:DPP IV N-terminal domain-containing protein [Sphingomonas sp. 7/4-4]WBY08887.1 DPP IV N-terminal domain-containing protein [Sphingomonas sp. 7/4-4]